MVKISAVTDSHYKVSDQRKGRAHWHIWQAFRGKKSL
jgi:hypothetical protein